jgi:hypothetical protein
VDDRHSSGPARPGKPSEPPRTPILDREEYVEQAYFFKTLQERMKDNLPVQELMEAIGHEILATTKLPLAVNFLLSELRHTGGCATAMARLPHYFTPFQTFVMQQAEDDRGRLDLRVALAVLQKEASYRAEAATPQGVFLYHFETLCRNRLNYDRGLTAMAADPVFDAAWQSWILTVRRQVGLVDLADLIFVRSDHYWSQMRRRAATAPRDPLTAPLFGEKEGRIALANRHKDPLLLFAAMQRHLGYPTVPRLEPPDAVPHLLPQLARRVERMEMRLKLLEEEQRGGVDLTKFYAGKQPFSPDKDP